MHSQCELMYVSASSSWEEAFDMIKIGIQTKPTVCIQYYLELFMLDPFHQTDNQIAVLLSIFI
jgi:hypothetical protein